ncbi:hypothetical protein F2Q68_00007526 [Brassica cretica]|uniref:OVATE domain-containing protein n=1 Tax=Brassica cretica TaxID=69181 RepID=A0A8S9KZQ4_BRACR|nr:hypothetical protein F2Q68_00007526 [Brassica cretica]
MATSSGRSLSADDTCGSSAELPTPVCSSAPVVVLVITPATGAQITEIKSKLSLQSEEVKVIGIVGPAGIGKTTIARVLYNQLSPDFPFSTFLENIRGSYEKPCGLLGKLPNLLGTSKVLGILLLHTWSESIQISKSAFDGMNNLQFLRVVNLTSSCIPEGLNCLPDKLRLLHWNSCPLRFWPSKFSTKFLVELIMPFSKLEKLWQGIKPLPYLKLMDLSGSEYLKEIPDLSEAMSLEKLDLLYCKSLLGITSSIGNATKLGVFKLASCVLLKELPSSIVAALPGPQVSPTVLRSPCPKIDKSVAMAKESINPFQDYKNSMNQMIHERDIETQDDLKELLRCFLDINPPPHHNLIVRAFVDVCSHLRPPHDRRGKSLGRLLRLYVTPLDNNDDD